MRQDLTSKQKLFEDVGKKTGVIMSTQQSRSIYPLCGGNGGTPHLYRLGDETTPELETSEGKPMTEEEDFLSPTIQSLS